MATNSQLIDSITKIASTSPDARTLMASLVELLKRERRHYTWVGIYLLQGQELVLGP
jgi:putative methionine-R-sulfoxide reductase with GAF domain